MNEKMKWIIYVLFGFLLIHIIYPFVGFETHWTQWVFYLTGIIIARSKRTKTQATFSSSLVESFVIKHDNKKGEKREI